MEEMILGLFLLFFFFLDGAGLVEFFVVTKVGYEYDDVKKIGRGETYRGVSPREWIQNA